MSLARNLANAAAVAGGLAPAGVVLPFAGATAPTGWLLCAGQTVSRTTYAGLFAVLGTTYGAGDGSTTFNLPDLRGRVPGGKDDMGGAAAGRLTSAGSGVDGGTLGAAGGAQTHTLTTAQLAAHNHGVTDPGHGHAVYDPGHAHATQTTVASGGYGLATNTQVTGAVGYADRAVITGGAGSPGSAGAGTGVSIYSGATGISTQNNGSGGAHNNTQPTVVLNYIIKT